MEEKDITRGVSFSSSGTSRAEGGEQAEENRKIRSTCFFWSRYDFF